MDCGTQVFNFFRLCDSHIISKISDHNIANKKKKENGCWIYRQQNQKKNNSDPKPKNHVVLLLFMEGGADYIESFMEDATSSETSVLTTCSTSVQKGVFSVVNISLIIHLKCTTMSEQFSCPPEYVLHGSSFKSNDKLSNDKSWNWGFCLLSKLVYFKTHPLELVESSMQVLTS